MMADMEESISRAPQMTSMAKASYGRGRGIMSPPMSDEFDPGADERKIIRNANLTVEVKDTENARTQTENILKSLEGAITHLNSWETRPGILSYNMTLRVPAEKLDDAIRQLVELGIKKSESYSTQDITAAYLDTENQIINLESRRDRLREMMNRKTENLRDVLEIDRELSNVQNQLDRLQRTQKGRDTNVDYSTLQLNLQPEPQIGDFTTPEWSTERSWRNAANDLIRDLQEIVDQGIRILVFFPIWGSILLIGWLIYRGKKKFFD